jgi:hypothetical protein
MMAQKDLCVDVTQIKVVVDARGLPAKLVVAMQL